MCFFEHGCATAQTVKPLSINKDIQFKLQFRREYLFFLYILGHLGPVLASVWLPESTDITQSRSVTVLKKKNN